jgi:hypothetical protein
VQKTVPYVGSDAAKNDDEGLHCARARSRESAAQEKSGRTNRRFRLIISAIFAGDANEHVTVLEFCLNFAHATDSLKSKLVLQLMPQSSELLVPNAFHLFRVAQAHSSKFLAGASPTVELIRQRSLHPIG